MMSIPKRKYVPHRTLRSGTTYIAVAGNNDIVIAIKVVVTKVESMLDANDIQLKTGEGYPLFAVASQNIIVTYTKEEWEQKKKMLEQGDAGD